MPKLMPRDITNEVRAVLRGAHFDQNRGRSYLTAYQILEKLPQVIRNRLINERGIPGQDAGTYYAAASVVSDAAEMLTGIEIAFLDTSLLKIMLGLSGDVLPGNPNIGLYRL